MRRAAACRTSRDRGAAFAPRTPPARRNGTVRLCADGTARSPTPLARLGRAARDHSLVLLGEGGGHPDGSALRRRYTVALERAGLYSLRFHDPPHLRDSRDQQGDQLMRCRDDLDRTNFDPLDGRDTAPQRAVLGTNIPSALTAARRLDQLISGYHRSWAPG